MVTRWNDKTQESYLRLRNSGMTEADIAKKLGFTRRTLYIKARALGLARKANSGIPKGYVHEKKRARNILIYQDHKKEIHINTLAEKYDLCTDRIKQIIKSFEQNGEVFQG
jgi:Mor family transcriptional regulator